jgi:RES domain-containing protein
VASDIAAIAVRGCWLKHTYPGSAALPEREPLPDNRWQRGEVVDAVYLADSEDTVWAEWYRHLAERAIPPLAQMPRDLWTWEVDFEVADLSTQERLAAVGLPVPRPGHRSWPAFQRVGEKLWKDGWPGLLAPSAARPEGSVLCLFRNAGGVRGAKALGAPRRITEPPPPPTGIQT